MTLGENIKIIRSFRNLTLSKLAKKVSVSVGYLSDIEKGKKTNPSMNFLSKIAEALDVPLDYLLRTSLLAVIEDRVLELHSTYEELSKKSGVSLEFIRNIDKLNNPDDTDLKNLLKLSDVLGLEPAILEKALAKQTAPVYDNKITSLPSADFEPVGEAFKIDMSNYADIPIVGSVRAGTPILAQDNIEGYQLTSKEHLCDDKDYFYLRVQGDSMNQEFTEGSLLLIEKASWVENGSIAVVLIDGMEATVKKVIQNENMITLIPMSTNPEHVPHMYDVIKDKISIVGRVKQAIKNY